MIYQWNPLWTDVIDAINPAYVASVRRMVMASINWLADHPQAVLEWREANQQALAMEAGLPEGASVVVIAPWEEIFKPKNADAQDWFSVMSDACGEGDATPTSFMMGKAMACGMLFKRDGWESFNQFMLERPGSELQS
jgi:hypothetical protein